MAGFFRRGTHDLVDVRTCEIQDPAITAIAEEVRGVLERLDVGVSPLPGVESDSRRRADTTESVAAARALTVRVALGTGEVLVGIVTTGGVCPWGATFASRIRDVGAGLTSASGQRVRVATVVRNLNDAETNVVLGRRSVPLLGPGWIEERFLGLRLRLSLTSFFQPNAAAARLAFNEIRHWLAPEKADRLVDAYAGIGVLALALSRNARQLTGIEESGEAVRDAAESARRNRISNVRFVQGTVGRALPEIAAAGPVDVLLLDPPRAGLDGEARSAVLAAAPRRIAYLSCSPTTFARDLAVLAPRYSVERVRAHDFLPQTEHVEALALLRRRDVA